MQPKPTIRESAVIAFNDTVGQTIDVVAGSLGTWRITYTAGSRGIAPGGGIKILRTVHKFWLGMVKQTTDPKAEDYCYAAATGQCTVKLLDVPLFYKRLNIATIRVEGEPLKPGQSISFVVGDSAKGTPLAEVPAYAQRNCGFEVSVDYDGSGTFVKLPRPLVVNVVPGRPVRGAVVCPSVVAAGEEFNVKVRFEDKNCNPGAAFTGVALFESTDPDAKLPRPATFTRRHKGIRMFRDVRLNTPGVHRIVLRDSEGEMELRSNPIRCVDEKPRVRVFWGDMHNHTEWADGTGSIEGTYLFARDRAFLDICAVTEHFAGSEGFPIPVVDKPLGDSAQFWPLAQRAVYDFYEPGTFVTLLGYEYTPRSGRGKVGDHCVYFLDPGHALVCDPSFGALVKRCAETDAL
ncbi:MAG: hypothetical protein FJ272_20760, partial [Planctomycetes bacterium]|nr:hypothetical protein [Planctomycetota bacterium]